jgi:hypothetical protein
MATVSRSWGAAAAQHLQLNPTSITLELSCTNSSPLQQKAREMERLIGLAAWLGRHGSVVSTLDVHAAEDQQQEAAGRGPGVSYIMEALAAAGKRLGPLQLQQLRLPALGGTHPAIINMGLSACQQLRQLRLDYSCGAGLNAPDDYLREDVCTALRQLTHLTSLALELDGFDPEPDMETVHPEQLDDFFLSLPISLVTLEVTFGDTDLDSPWYAIAPCSLQHLTALQQLDVPQSMHFGDSDAGNVLAPLTALTYLAYAGAMVEEDQALLALPNLSVVWTYYSELHLLTGLEAMTALRTLHCMVHLDHGPAASGAMAQLTSLTQLDLWVVEIHHCDLPSDLDVEVVATWGAALSSLTRLQSLVAEPEVLEQVNITALTALTQLEVTAGGRRQPYSQQELEQLLQRLAPVRGRLQVVKLVGLPPSQKQSCRAAVVAALGPASVVFDGVMLDVGI